MLEGLDNFRKQIISHLDMTLLTDSKALYYLLIKGPTTQVLK